MEWERQLLYSFEEGKEEAKIEAAKKIMQEFQVSPEKTAQIVDLPLERLNEEL